MKISKYGICYSNVMVNIYIIIIVIFVTIVVGCVSKMCAQILWRNLIE